jgi:anaerobic selenocysteine-containing dehydrogenase
VDGNTRLCTATAAAALKASFGTDGQPGSYADVDHCDAIALWGQTWPRPRRCSGCACWTACAVPTHRA